MTKIQRNTVLAIALVLIVAAAIYANTGLEPKKNIALEENLASSTPAAASTTPSTSATAGTTQPKKPAASAPAPTQASGMKIISPVAGATWIAGTNHIIRWNAVAGYPGAINLLDASTKNVVGWIAPNIGVSQVEYSWNAKTVMLSRTNPASKELLPGSYIVQIVFDGPRAAMQSPAFVVASSGEDRTLTKDVFIKNLRFTPNTVSLNRGEYLLVRNDAPEMYEVRMNGALLATLKQWSTYVFDSNLYAMGAYEFNLYEAGKPQALTKMGVTVK